MMRGKESTKSIAAAVDDGYRFLKTKSHLCSHYESVRNGSGAARINNPLHIRLDVGRRGEVNAVT